MSEAWVLSLVERYPNRAALARRVRDASVFLALRRLEAHGLLRRQHDQYRLTRRGRDELALTSALIRLLVR
jgi:DNA-binding PadR family transcriptional regulator